MIEVLKVFCGVSKLLTQEFDGLVRAVGELNATCSWRYLTVFELWQHEAPISQDLHLKRGSTQPEIHESRISLRFEPPDDWTGIDVLLAVAQGMAPAGLAGFRSSTSAGPVGGAPIYVGLHHQSAAEPAGSDSSSSDLAHLAYSTQAEFVERIRFALASIARRRWLEKRDADRLICLQCGHSALFPWTYGRCPSDAEVLVLPHRARKKRSGEHVGKYPIHGRIGKGGFANIYLSVPEDGPPVAVKQLRTTQDVQFTERFERELDLLARLDHPNLVRLIDRFQTPSGTVGILEFLSGRTLDLVLDALSPRQVFKLSVQLLAALGAIHDSRIIHRDLKPQNIMLVDDFKRPEIDPQLILLDFGVAKQSQDPNVAPVDLTENRILGTFCYMSPEQIAHARDVDHRTDLYSVGVILFQGTDSSKRPPFDDFPEPTREIEAFLKVVQRVKTEPVQQPDRPDVPQEAKDIVMRALAKTPDQRFADAHEMREAVERIVARWDELISADRSLASNEDWQSWAPVEHPGFGTSSLLHRRAIPSSMIENTPAQEPTTSRRLWSLGKVLLASVFAVILGGAVAFGMVRGLSVPAASHDAVVVNLRAIDDNRAVVPGVSVVVNGQIVGVTAHNGELRHEHASTTGDWLELSVVEPAGYRLAAGAKRSLSVALNRDGRRFGRVRAKVYLEKHYLLQHPDNTSMIPIALGDGYLVLMAPFESFVAFQPDRDERFVLPAHTELHSCDGQPPPTWPSSRPSTAAVERQLKVFLKHCYGQVRSKMGQRRQAEFVLQVRRPDQALEKVRLALTRGG